LLSAIRDFLLLFYLTSGFFEKCPLTIPVIHCVIASLTAANQGRGEKMVSMKQFLSLCVILFNYFWTDLQIHH